MKATINISMDTEILGEFDKRLKTFGDERSSLVEKLVKRYLKETELPESIANWEKENAPAVPISDSEKPLDLDEFGMP